MTQSVGQLWVLQVREVLPEAQALPPYAAARATLR